MLEWKGVAKATKLLGGFAAAFPVAKSVVLLASRVWYRSDCVGNQNSYTGTTPTADSYTARKVVCTTVAYSPPAVEINDTWILL